MEDEQIIDLYFQRKEQAIVETRQKYGGYCSAIAYRILESYEDTEECVSDTYLRTWNSIPPRRPQRLQAFLGRITRNLAMDRYRAAKTQKRGGFTEILEELQIEALEDPGEALEQKELAAAISRLKKALEQEEFDL